MPNSNKGTRLMSLLIVYLVACAFNFFVLNAFALASYLFCKQIMQMQFALAPSNVYSLELFYAALAALFALKTVSKLK
jgi:hypothetical protein